jgi:bifunctional enzyme CysN/CysC
MRVGTATVPVRVTGIKHKVDVNSLEHHAARTLHLNEVGFCNLDTTAPVAVDAFADFPATGSFILIDRQTNATVGAGMVSFALRRATNVHRQAVTVDRAARERLNAHPAKAVWFTGLSGSGKSTIANLLEQKLHAHGIRTYLLDGDNVRHGLNRDLGFTDADRVENIRRVAEVSKLMVEAGLITLVSFISPFRSERQMARDLVETSEFIEIFVDTPLAVAEERDVKGLYKKARSGALKNFTGIDSPYEAPITPEIHIDTTKMTPEQAADLIVERLRDRGLIKGGWHGPEI